MRHLLILTVLGLAACGPVPVKPDAANPAGCPATYESQADTPCGSAFKSCHYTGPSRACGAGSSNGYGLECPGTQDGGVATWLLQATCL
jgi:hypothetical protein